MLRALIPQMRGVTGIIILDLPDAHPDDLQALTAEVAPGAIVLAHTNGKLPTVWADESGGARIEFAADHDHMAEPIDRSTALMNDMWRHRALAMLLAFARSGQVYDARCRPDIDLVDPSHPAMHDFLSNLPGYRFDRRERGQQQDGKTKEQFGFLAMQM